MFLLPHFFTMSTTLQLPKKATAMCVTSRFHLNMKCIFILIMVTITSAGRPPPLVTINKCCRIGEQMDENRNCLIGGTEKWVPHVYLIGKNDYFMPKGEAPRFFKFREQTIPACDKPDLFLGPNSVVIFSNGTLFVSEKSRSVAPTDYCVEKDAALACFPRPNGAESLIAPLSKVKKCCGLKSVYQENSLNCVKLNEDHAVLSKNLINTSSNIDIIYGFPHCTDNHQYTIASKFSEEYLDVNTGTVTLESSRTFKWNEYCLEHTINSAAAANNSSEVNVFTCAEHFSMPESVHVNHEDVRFVLYSIGLLISVIFLSATLATGFLLPNHHVLHWRCQTYYVACLLVGDLLLAITQISGNTIVGSTCVTMAIFMHFFFLAAFFWLNTMCFNIWWTFRDFRPTSLEKGQEIVRLRIYQVYAWGVPLIICGVATILDNMPRTEDDTYLRPRFGEKKCWFYGDIEILTYFYGPIGILLFVNFLLFASTARQLTCGLWKRDEVKSTTERAALGRVCLKLVVVMGVTWMADVISWVVGGPHYFWYLTDLINALQGVLIFIVVGCQPQVWTALKRIWGAKTGRGTTNTTNAAQHSSSSQGLPSIGDSITNNTTASSKIPMETIC